MEGKIQLVFGGEFTPEVPAEVAKENLGKLLKLEPARVEALCAAGRAVLKKNLPPEEAARYVSHLAKLGIRVKAELQPEPPAPAPPAAAVPAAPAAAATAATAELVPVAEDFVCPKCGERQPKRTLCRACGIDMPRFLAAQEEAKRAPASPEAAAATGDAGAADGGDGLAEPPPMFSLSGHGRLGRLSYWHAGNVLLVLLIWLLMVALKAGAVKLALVLAIPFGIAFIRLGVLRCHDLNWNGWLVLLSAIPYVGGIFSLLLLVLPGHGANDYGEPTRPVSGKVALASFVGVLFSGYLLFSMAASQLGSLMGQRFAAGAQAAVSQPDAAGNRVILYVEAECPPCDAKAKELAGAGIGFHEVALDEDPAATVDVLRKLKAQNYQGQDLHLPMVEVNGVVLPNDPDLAEIRRHLS